MVYNDRPRLREALATPERLPQARRCPRVQAVQERPAGATRVRARCAGRLMLRTQQLTLASNCGRMRAVDGIRKLKWRSIMNPRIRSPPHFGSDSALRFCQARCQNLPSLVGIDPRRLTWTRSMSTVPRACGERWLRRVSLNGAANGTQRYPAHVGRDADR